MLCKGGGRLHLRLPKTPSQLPPALSWHSFTPLVPIGIAAYLTATRKD